jgi:hypothetical protein
MVDILGHTLKVVKHVFVRLTLDMQSQTFQIGLPDRVLLRRILMDRPIDLNDQTAFGAVKIHNKALYRVLATEFRIRDLSVTENIP